MSEDEQLEQLINQTLDGAMASIPSHLLEIEQNKDVLKVDNPKEFVFGLIMGMALGMASAMLSAMKKRITHSTGSAKDSRHGFQKGSSN